jgi:UV DNA damage endonuclease
MESRKLKSKIKHKEIRIGYACINTDLGDFDILTSRTLRLATAHDKGIEYIKKIAIENINDLFKILIYNEAHGIRFYRITSSLFPHLSNPKLIDSDYGLDFVKNQLKIIGQYAKKHGHRLTMHPGQYVQLGSTSEDVVKQSIIELMNHVNILKTMNYGPDNGSVLIVHGGGTFGDKKSTLERWKYQFQKLPIDVASYIALENDENHYNINDLLPLCEELNIPFCLDIFHNRVSKDYVPITRKLINRIFNTWKNRNMIPKIHISEQEAGLRKGAHSKTLKKIPLYVFKMSLMFDTALDIMLEVKDKQESTFKMYYKYFNIKMDITGRITFVLKQKIIDKIKMKEKIKFKNNSKSRIKTKSINKNQYGGSPHLQSKYRSHKCNLHNKTSYMINKMMYISLS